MYTYEIQHCFANATWEMALHRNLRLLKTVILVRKNSGF